MKPKIKIAGLALSGLLTLAPSLGAQPRVIVRPSFGYYGYYGYYPHRFYAWPEPMRAFPYRSAGEVKIETRDKEAGVYVDGGYLGAVRKFKTFNLRPGAHDIELRDAGGKVLFHEKVAIVPGKTTRVDAMGIVG